MMEILKERFTIVFVALVVLVLISAMQCVSIVFFLLNHETTEGKSERDLMKLVAFEVIDKALDLPLDIKHFSFRETGGGSFRHYVSGKERQEAEAQNPVKVLYLKGILQSKTPLAILADEQGNTTICKEGDVIDERTIVKIQKDQVTIKDRNGTTKLTVKEQ